MWVPSISTGFFIRWLWAAALDIPPSSPVPLRPVMVTVPASSAVAAGAAGAWISAGLIAPAADWPA